MRARAAIGTMVLGAVALGGCWVPGGPAPAPVAVLELTIAPFSASNPCVLGCSASTLVTVTNTGDAATAVGVEVTAAPDAPSLAYVFPSPEQACSDANALDPGESCTVILSALRPQIAVGLGAVNDPGIASGQVTATSGSQFENELYSVTLG